ncbi:hypothetical protein HDV00_005434 [Rhizophlyctis rosea]|nr:hypothetical protein HDV00_005434 [Rhizophlyctis rosea]
MSTTTGKDPSAYFDALESLSGDESINRLAASLALPGGSASHSMQQQRRPSVPTAFNRIVGQTRSSVGGRPLSLHDPVNTLPGVPTGLLKVAEKRHGRTTGHLETFTRINVIVSPTVSFSVIADKNRTIEYLSHQIEAEYTYRFLFPNGKVEDKSGAEMGQEEDELKHEPLECGLLCDENMNALRFEDTIGAVLTEDTKVHVMNVYEGKEIWSSVQVDSTTVTENLSTPKVLDALPTSIRESVADKLDKLSSSFVDSAKPVPVAAAMSGARSRSINELGRSDVNLLQAPAEEGKIGGHHRCASLTLDDRLQWILHSRSALESFISFCVEDHTVENLLFWFEAEIFQHISANDRLLYARYLYFTYLCGGAPMRINLSEEIRRDVALPTDSIHVDNSMFDEAQEIIYAALKGQAFVRFERTNWEELLPKDDNGKFCVLEKSKFYRGTPAEFDEISIEPTFDMAGITPDMSLVNDIIAVVDPATAEFRVSAARAKLGANSGSSNIRDQILTCIIKHYHPTCRLLPIIAYFDDSRRMTANRRATKIHKEKKIAKFFGERPSFEQIQRQLALASRQAGASAASGQLPPSWESAVYLSSMDTIESVAGGEGAGASDKYSKLKRVEKLQDFFGASLPKQQLRAQQLAAQRESVTGSAEFGRSPEVESRNSSASDVARMAPAPPMLNELAPEQKRVLTKRNKKIASMLGQPLDESLAQKIAEPLRKVGSRDLLTALDLGTLGRTGGGGDGLKSPTTMTTLERQAKNAPLSSSAPSIVSVATNPESEEAFDQSIDVLADLKSEQVNTNATRESLFRPSTRRRRASEGSIRSIGSGTSSVAEAPPSPTSREYRIKKLQKLQQFLGERLTNQTLQDEAATATGMIAQQKGVNRPLTAEERQTFTKKTSKLERVFGALPPAQMVAIEQGSAQRKPAAGQETERESAASRYHHAMQNISEMLRSDRSDVLDILDTLSEIDRDADDPSTVPGDITSPPGGRRVSTTTDPARLRMLKARKRARAQKLRKFFGTTPGSVDVDTIIERRIMADLERSLEKEIDNPEDLSVLKQDLAELREELKKKGDVITRELSAVDLEDLAA